MIAQAIGDCPAVLALDARAVRKEQTFWVRCSSEDCDVTMALWDLCVFWITHKSPPESPPDGGNNGHA